MFPIASFDFPTFVWIKTPAFVVSHPIEMPKHFYTQDGYVVISKVAALWFEKEKGFLKLSVVNQFKERRPDMDEPKEKEQTFTFLLNDNDETFKRLEKRVLRVSASKGQENTIQVDDVLLEDKRRLLRTEETIFSGLFYCHADCSAT